MITIYVHDSNLRDPVTEYIVKHIWGKPITDNHTFTVRCDPRSPGPYITGAPADFMISDELADLWEYINSLERDNA